MRSNELDLSKYGSDKLSYLKHYDTFFSPRLNIKTNLLELGIYKGESLLLWRDYFPKGNIVGIDIHLPINFQSSERIHMYEGSQDDPAFLSSVARHTAPDGFDIIIDDASHYGELSKRSFWHLFEHHLKSGGIYAIEDWGTGYWGDWPDGMELDLHAQENNFGIVSKDPLDCHSYGMVGFIKQLIDEQGAADATKNTIIKRPSKFENMVITPFVVFIQKA